jgi:hypothetical protein
VDADGDNVADVAEETSDWSNECNITLDKTAPSVPANGTPHGIALITNNFDFNWDDSIDNSPITYIYQASQNPAQTGGVLTTSLWSSGVLPTSMIHSSGAGDGVWYWQVKAKDAAGNESAWSPIWNVTLDTIAPTIPGQIGWSTENPAVGSDYTSGSDFSDYKTCGQSVNYSPMTNLWGPSVDANGVAGYDREVYSPDETTLIYSSSLSANYVNGGGATDGSTYWVRVRAYDETGNKSAWTAKCAIKYDTSAPTVDLVFPTPGPSATSFQAQFSEDVNEGEAENPANYFLNNWPGAGGSGDLVGDATIVYDAGSKIATISFTASGWYVSPEQEWGVQNIHDLAGNLQAVSPYAETSTPMVAPVTTDSGTDANWHNSAVMVNLTCTDVNGSGCKNTFYTTNGDTPTTSSTSGNTVTLNTDGIFTIKYLSVDNAGNVEGVKSGANQVKIDTIAPTITVNNPNSDPAQTKMITASTNEGTLSQSVNAPGVTTCDVSLIFVSYTDTTFSTEADNGRAICYRAIDAADNITYQLSSVIAGIDRTAPRIDSVDSDGKTFNSADLPRQKIKVTLSEDIINVPVINVHSIVGNQSVNDCGDSDARTFCFDYTIPVSDLEMHTIEIYSAYDRANNPMVSDSSHTFMVDTVAPVVDITSPAAGFVAGTVDIRGTVTDANPHHYYLVIKNSSNNVVAGPNTVYNTSSFTNQSLFHWDTKSGSFPDGTYIIDLEARDAADNKDAGSVKTVSVTVDNTAPTSSVTAGSYTFGVWTSNNVTVVFGCDDSGSGCETTPNSNQYPYYCVDNNNTCTPGTATHDRLISGEGVWYVRYFSRDNVGNEETIQSVQVKIDKTVPTSVITTFSLADNGSITTPTWDGLVEGTAADDRSGVSGVRLEITRMLFGSETTEYWNGSAWQEATASFLTTGTATWSYQLPGTVEEGTYHVSSHAVDNAGNVENTYSITIIYDKTIPEVTLAIDPVNPNGDNGWYDTKPVITLTPTDNYQVDHIEYQLNSTGGSWITYAAPVTLNDGIWQFYYRSIDTASNVSAIGLKNVKIDTNNPDNVKNIDATYKQSPNRVQLTWDANDSDIDLVYIYRGKSKNFSVNTSSRIAKNNRSDEKYSDYDVEPGEKYYYKFVTVDNAGNKSSVKVISIELPLEGTIAVVTDEGTEALPEGTVLGAETSTEENSGTQAVDENTTNEQNGRVLGEETETPSTTSTGISFWWWLFIALVVGGVGYYGFYRRNRK